MDAKDLASAFPCLRKVYTLTICSLTAQVVLSLGPWIFSEKQAPVLGLGPGHAIQGGVRECDSANEHLDRRVEYTILG